MREKVFPSATLSSLNPVSQVLSPRCVSINEVLIFTFRTQLLICSESENQHLINPLLYLPWTEPGHSMHYVTIRGR
jgi:hypothetical protein